VPLLPLTPPYVPLLLAHQIDPPSDWESYIHRSGRTGRANKPGTCVMCVTRKMEYMVSLILARPAFPLCCLPELRAAWLQYLRGQLVHTLLPLVRDSPHRCHGRDCCGADGPCRARFTGWACPGLEESPPRVPAIASSLSACSAPYFFLHQNMALSLTVSPRNMAPLFACKSTERVVAECLQIGDWVQTSTFMISRALNRMRRWAHAIRCTGMHLCLCTDRLIKT